MKKNNIYPAATSGDPGGCSSQQGRPTGGGDEIVIAQVVMPRREYEQIKRGTRRQQCTLGYAGGGLLDYHPHFRSAAPRQPLTRAAAVAKVLKLLKRVDYPRVPLYPGLDLFVVPDAGASLFGLFGQEEGEYQPDADLFMSDAFGRTRA